MQGLVAEVAQAYGIGDPVEVEELTTGVMNHTWRVVAQHGTYIVKQVIDVDLERTLRQQEFVKVLADKGFPVPRPLDPLVVRPDGVFEATPLFEGVQREWPDLDQARSADLGTLLGRVHEALATIRPATGEPRPERAIPDPRKTIEAIDRYRKHLVHKADHDDYDRYADVALREQRGLLERWGMRRPLHPPRGPEGWIHGDFTDHNVLWKGGEISALIDWDRLRVWHLAHEPVRAAMFMHPYDLEKIAAFMQGYRSVISMDDEDVADAVQHRWYSTLNSLWPVNTHYDKGETRCDRYYYGATERLASWCENYDELVAAFVSRPSRPSRSPR